MPTPTITQGFIAEIIAASASPHAPSITSRSLGGNLVLQRAFIHLFIGARKGRERETHMFTEEGARSSRSLRVRRIRLADGSRQRQTKHTQVSQTTWVPSIDGNDATSEHTHSPPCPPPPSVYIYTMLQERIAELLPSRIHCSAAQQLKRPVEAHSSCCHSRREDCGWRKVQLGTSSTPQERYAARTRKLSHAHLLHAATHSTCPA